MIPRSHKVITHFFLTLIPPIIKLLDIEYRIALEQFLLYYQNPIYLVNAEHIQNNNTYASIPHMHFANSNFRYEGYE